MKLSEAIRLGSTLSQQAHYITFIWNQGQTEILNACALGAAWHAAGLSHLLKNGALFYQHHQMFPIIDKAVIHPKEPNKAHTVMSTIISLNDEYNLTREVIADWVESVEIQLAQQEQQKELVHAS